MNLALNKIFNKHIETHTDAYAASSIIDSLDESIFKLFLVNPKPLTPREKTPTPIPVRPCSWQETSMENDSEIFQLSIVEEADNLQAMQEKIRKKRRQNEQAIPSWLRQPGLQKSDSGISMLQESTRGVCEFLATFYIKKIF